MCAAFAGCACRTVAPSPTEVPLGRAELAQACLRAFTDAVARGDFAAVRERLAAPWRERYTAAHLQRDFALDPLAQERVDGVREALAVRPVLDGDRATFPLPGGKAVQLTFEGGEYRVQALE